MKAHGWQDLVCNEPRAHDEQFIDMVHELGIRDAQVEPASENPYLVAEHESSFRRLGADARIAHQGPMPTTRHHQ
jgi:hypothetical protein